MFGKKRNNDTHEKQIDPELITKAFAKAIADGDIVNLKFLFGPFSPARKTSPERFETEKYSYMIAVDDQENDPVFADALRMVGSPEIQKHIETELAANRPAQLPSELVLALGDNAVRLKKYTSAAQAYELLRIRARMQEQTLELADEALDVGDIKKAARGYVIATGLEYDYAAFPEPLPKTPNYQMNALILHGEYPLSPEDCLPLRETSAFLQIALGYILLNNEIAARLEKRSIETRTEFLRELVRMRDPGWDGFLARYREAIKLRHEFAERIRRANAIESGGESDLENEIDKSQGEDPVEMPRALLGRTIDNGTWWQYLKELAYTHPAAILFTTRQLIGGDEIIVPLHNDESPVAKALGLVSE